MIRMTLFKARKENRAIIPNAVIVGFGRTQTLQYKCCQCGDLFFPINKAEYFCSSCAYLDCSRSKVDTDEEFYINISDWIQKTCASSKRKEINLKKIMKRDNYTCQYCEYSPSYCLEYVPLHVDHIIPFVSGGSNSPRNLVVACEWCNLHLSSKIFSGFAEKKIYICEKRQEKNMPCTKSAWVKIEQI